MPTASYSDLPLHFSNKELERGKVECRLPLLLCLLHGGRDALVTLRLTAHHGLSAWPYYESNTVCYERDSCYLQPPQVQTVMHPVDSKGLLTLREHARPKLSP